LVVDHKLAPSLNDLFALNSSYRMEKASKYCINKLSFLTVSFKENQLENIFLKDKIYLNIKEIKLSDFKFLFQVNESNRHIVYFTPLIK